jgi:hypothetical protein
MTIPVVFANLVAVVVLMALAVREPVTVSELCRGYISVCAVLVGTVYLGMLWALWGVCSRVDLSRGQWWLLALCSWIVLISLVAVVGSDVGTAAHECFAAMFFLAWLLVVGVYVAYVRYDLRSVVFFVAAMFAVLSMFYARVYSSLYIFICLEYISLSLLLFCNAFCLLAYS